MGEFWETKFQEINTMWGLEPSDSAIKTCDLFNEHHIHDILIPGVGYGRNAKIFIEAGINVTGIEISESAIKLARKTCKLDFPIHHGSVTQMPFENKKFDGIFCYALIHLLNKFERKKLIKNCFNQLSLNGYMIFVAVSKKASMFGNGRQLSKNRFEITKGLNVYFYDLDYATTEFNDYGLIDIQEFDEPIKHMDNEQPLKCILVTCKK
jgi:2-polyprenyl-3-methyl-5-hydroxy-6-metoxy-1,4-benzoquinol methylase